MLLPVQRVLLSGELSRRTMADLGLAERDSTTLRCKIRPVLLLYMRKMVHTTVKRPIPEHNRSTGVPVLRLKRTPRVRLRRRISTCRHETYPLKRR
ncbi:hypothetical protein E2C01_074711 [Portunus trituberculatus]|uniref:Uncharacterized protein n=1 Tax=Portunus trituberculatus TaxID=210409 RepID=A0A5B7I8Q5_PORTR|nr:hypothetical protein [Portunus trituberculatus]